MQNRMLLVFSALLLFLLIFDVSYGQEGHYGASTSYQLKWKGVSSVGNSSASGDSVRSASYVLTSTGGQGTSVNDSLYSHSATVKAFPGFIKLFHDWRNPYSWITGVVATSDTVRVDSFLVEWSGIDTTREDGVGWGLRNYTVQYSTNPTSGWTTWFTTTTLTSAWFGTSAGLPIPTEPSHWYYFRVQACDYATNCATDWSNIDSIFVFTTTYTLTVRNEYDVPPFAGGKVWVNGTEYDSPKSVTVGPGSSVIIAANDVFVAGDTIRYTFTGWSDGISDRTRTVVVNSDSTITANYDTEYRFMVSNPDGWDTPVPAVGSYWYHEGVSVCASVTGHVHDVLIGDIISTGFTGTGSAISSPDTSYCFNINAPSSIQWNWAANVCTLFVWTEYGTGAPVDTILIESGESWTQAIEASASGHTCTGWVGFGSVPASGTTNTVTFTIYETSHLVWQWGPTTRMPFIVFNPLGYGDPEPAVGVHWYDALSTVSARVDSVSGTHYNIGYIGTGDLPARGYPHYTSFSITRPTSLTWQWADDAVQLIVTSAFGSPTPPGITFYPRHTVLTLTGNAVTTIDEGETRRILQGWTGTGSVPATGTENTVTVTLDENSTITWNWRTEHHIQLDFAGTGGITPDPLLTPGWFVSDTVITLNAQHPIDALPIGYYAFRKWTAVPSAAGFIADSFSNLTTLTVNRPFVITANYSMGIPITFTKSPATDTYGGFTIDGTFMPGATVTVYWDGIASHTVQASTPDESGDTVRYEFVNWDGSSTLNPMTVAPSGVTTYTANYNKFYKVTVQKNPLADIYGQFSVGSTIIPRTAPPTYTGWHAASSSLDIHVQESDIVIEGDRFHFTGWASGETDTILNYPALSAAINLTANYTHQYNLHVCKVYIVGSDTIGEVPEGIIYFDGVAQEELVCVDEWYDSSTCVDVLVPETVEGYSDIYEFLLWQDTRSTTELRNVCLNSPADLRAVYYQYSTVISLRFAQYGRSLTYTEPTSLTDSLYWNIGTIDVEESRTTSYISGDAGSTIRIYNTSDIRVDYGLKINGLPIVIHRDADTSSWNAGILSGPERFSLRAFFTDSSLVPSFLTRMSLDGTIEWTSDGVIGNASEFNAGVAPGSGPHAVADSSDKYLWFNFLAPQSSRIYDVDRRIPVIFNVRSHTP